MTENAEAIWAAKADDELVEASGELFEYTEAGERIIRAELRRRGLPEPDPAIGTCSRCGRSIAWNHPDDRCRECGEPFPLEIRRTLRSDTPESTLVAVLRTEDPGLVPVAKSMLDEEGIEHLVRGEGLQDPFGGLPGSYGRGPVEFWVREEDADRARVLLDGLGAPPAPPDGGPRPSRAGDALELLRDLVAHKGHANAALLEAIRGNPSAADDPEIRELLHHILLANRFWLLAILGAPFVLEDETRQAQSIDELVQRYAATQAQETAWFEAATRADPARMLKHARIPNGECSVAHAFMQVCLHSHGHRAQCAKLLRRHGVEPPTVDFILWATRRA